MNSGPGSLIGISVNGEPIKKYILENDGKVEVIFKIER